MKIWVRALAKGKNRLAKHDPQGALGYLQQALEDCPSTNRKDTTAILFYTGIALRKLGYASGAIKSWNIAAKLHKDGYCSQMLERLTNVYGMEKCSSIEEDDRRAFCSLQLNRYLEGKNNGCLESEAEWDVVNSLIEEAWETLGTSGRLAGLHPVAKLKLFKETLIVFPLFECPDDFSYTDNVLAYDFVRTKKVKLSDRCHCGSGRPHMACCGRIPPFSDLKIGVF